MKFIQTLFTTPLTWGVLALILFLSFLTPWIYPGEAATWMAHLTGVMPSTAIETHPLATLFFGTIVKRLPLSCAVPVLNGLSALIGALCVTLFCAFIKRFFYVIVTDMRSRPAFDLALTVALPMGALALLLSPAFFLASTHLQWQTFDLFLLLGVALLILRTIETQTLARLCVASLATGLVALESPITLLLTPLIIVVLITIYISNTHHASFKVLTSRILIPMGLGALLVLFAAAAMQLRTIVTLHPDSSITLLNCLINFLLALANTLIQFFTIKGWLLLILFGILPGVLALFTGHAIGSNLRTVPILIAYLTIIVLAGLTFFPISTVPDTLFATLGEFYPVGICALTAFAVAFVAGASVFFFKIKVAPEATSESRKIRSVARLLGRVFIILLPVAVIGGGAIRSYRVHTASQAVEELPRTTVDLILSAADRGELWLLSNALLDPYLALRIAETQKPVIRLSRQEEKQYKQATTTKILAAMDASPIFATLFEKQPSLRTELEHSLVDIGDLLSFIQDWMRVDEAAMQHFITLDVPDLWFSGNREPLPEHLWYRGAKDRLTRDANLTLPSLPEAFSDEALTVEDTTPFAARQFAKLIRRHVGFMANNTAYFFAYTPQKQDAYKLFRATYTFDPENASAFINLADLLKGKQLEPALPQTEEAKTQYTADVKWLSDERAWCAEEMTAWGKRTRGRKIPLAKHFGYVRSPQVMAATFGNWAMTGATGAILSHIDMQIELLDDNLVTAAQKSALRMAVTANLYSQIPNKRKEAIKIYRELLAKSTQPAETIAYLHSLVRMNILEGNLEEAYRLLVRAENLAIELGRLQELAYTRALYHAANGEPLMADMALQTYLTHYPKNVEATAMLATLQLQAKNIDEVRDVTIKRLITAAGTEDNYYVKILQAQLAEHAQNLKMARTAYLRALALRPDVVMLRDTILTLDIRLNDRASAAEHAKKFLYQDRTHPLANYVMGSIALNDGDNERAIAYLTNATASNVTPPLPEAFNDLAETYRRLRRWTEAYATAQQAYKLAPKLPVAHETAAAALLELGRYKEAHAELDTATQLDQALRPGVPIDPRFLITRARLLAKEGKPDLARIKLAEAYKQYTTLDPGAKKEFDTLSQKLKTQF